MSRRHPRRKTTAARFAKLPVKVLDHVAVTTLSHATFRMMALLTAQYHGYNNGALGITRRQAAEKGIGSDHTVYEALRMLEDLLGAGFHTIDAFPMWRGPISRSMSTALARNSEIDTSRALAKLAGL